MGRARSEGDRSTGARARVDPDSLPRVKRTFTPKAAARGVPRRRKQPFTREDPFDFALFVSIRTDCSDSGVEWGLLEDGNERLGMRALMIATRGNALCMVWGNPADLGLSGNRDSDGVIAARCVHSY